MKKFLFSLAMLVNLAIQASSTVSPAMTFAPNYYKCSGNGVELVYSIGYWDANQPHYTLEILSGVGGKPFFARDDSVTRESTVLGEVVSATFDAIPDLMTKVASVVLPKINLQDPVYDVEFNTHFIVTEKATSFGGPGFVVGLVDHSKSVVVKCRASAVL